MTTSMKVSLTNRKTDVRAKLKIILNVLHIIMVSKLYLAGTGIIIIFLNEEEKFQNILKLKVRIDRP